MCENGCGDCGEDAGIDTQLLIEFNKIVGYLTILTDKVDELEKKQNKLQKKFRKFIRGYEFHDELEVPEGLIESLQEAFVNDFLGKREDKDASNTPQEVKPKVTLTKNPPVVKDGKPKEGNPNTVKVTVTKTTKPSTEIMYSITEFLDSIGVDVSPELRRKYLNFMALYAKAPADVKVFSDGTTRFSKKSLKEGFIQILS